MRRSAMRFLAMAAGVVLLAGSQSVRAGSIININQVGSNVVASGSGSVDFTDLTPVNFGNDYSSIDPGNGRAVVGPSSGAGVIIYDGVTGPTSFGSGAFKSPNSGSGDLFGIEFDSLELPGFYTSGASLNGSATFSNQTLSSLGLTAGTYTYTWGTGAHADSLTVQIGPATMTAVPLPSSFAGGSVLLAMVGILTWRRRAEI